MSDIIVYNNGEIELNIFIDEELNDIAVVKDCLTTAKKGDKYE